MSFERALAAVLLQEGGFVNHPLDRGGTTNKGITQKVYDAWRISHNQPKRSVAEIGNTEVAAIYMGQYWNPAWCEKMPEHLGLIHFDAAVNHGVHRAIKLLQRAVGANDDGLMGRETMKSLETALAMTSEGAVINAYLDERSGFYEEIVKKNPTQVAFIKGWKNRLHSLRYLVG